MTRTSTLPVMTHGARILGEFVNMAVMSRTLSDGPLAYFLTFSAYGTRLHGDERGTVDRDHNTPFEPPLPSSPAWVEAARARMKGRPAYFDEPARKIIERSFAETCSYRGWQLLAVHCRTNHVHAVASAMRPPEGVMHDLKTYATRALRAAGRFEPRQPVWASHGSTRYLWNEHDVSAACTYTIDGQGMPLPGSDRLHRQVDSPPL